MRFEEAFSSEPQHHRILVNGVLVTLSAGDGGSKTTTLSVVVARGNNNDSNAKHRECLVHVVNLGAPLHCDVVLTQQKKRHNNFDDDDDDNNNNNNNKTPPPPPVAARASMTLKFGGVGTARLPHNEEEQKDERRVIIAHIVLRKPEAAMNYTERVFATNVGRMLEHSGCGDDHGRRRCEAESGGGGAASVAGIVARLCSTTRAPAHADRMVAALNGVNAFDGKHGGGKLCVARKAEPVARLQKMQATTTTTTTATTTEEALASATILSSSSFSSYYFSSCSPTKTNQAPPQAGVVPLPPFLNEALEIAAIAQRAAHSEALWRQCAASFSTMMRHLQKSPEHFRWECDANKRTVIMKN